MRATHTARLYISDSDLNLGNSEGKTKLKKVIDIICVSLVLVFIFGLFVLNIAQPNRPTVSEAEKRELAKFPKLTATSLADGTFFAGVSLFISDTFVFRDKLVTLSKELDSLKGFKYSLGDGDDFVVIDPNKGNNDAEETSEVGNKLDDLLNNLDNPSTEPPETDPPVTEPPVTEQPETDPFETTDTEPEFVEIPSVNAPGEIQLDNGDIVEIVGYIKSEDYEVTELTLSKTSINLTVGTGAVVTANVKATGSGGAALKWNISDPDVATISMNSSGGISIKMIAKGECILTCESVDGISATCNIVVTEINAPTNNDNAEADFLPNGLFLHGGAVYTVTGYSEYHATKYAQTGLYYKKIFGDDVRVSLVVAPVSSMVIDNPTLKAQISDQKVILEKMAALADPSVNFVDTYSKMYEHRTEYLYFKSDHHWTARGAYYAYAAFAESVGFEPTPLDKFEYAILSDSYNGSMYTYTQRPEVKNYIDTVEAFYPTKVHTMTITDVYGRVYNYDSSIVAGHHNYLSFISGDHPYTVINVPENPQDRNVIVFKDSFGNAFVPFLVEHYGNIFVIDVRHTSMNVYEQFKDYDITDIIFMNNIQAANSASWYQMYLKAAGVQID